MAGEHAYMTVPEKIELSNSGMGYSQPPSSDHRYNPMKIPDTITLESSNPPMNGGGIGAGGGGRGGGGGGVGEREDPRYFDEVKRTEEVRQQPKAQEEKLIPLRPSEVPASTVPDHEQRIGVLETKVQRLTETILQHKERSNSNNNRGNGFWSVLTFATWLLVPLIVVAVHQLKK